MSSGCSIIVFCVRFHGGEIEKSVFVSVSLLSLLHSSQQSKAG